MVLDGYVRISRVGGRAGDSFISPDVQRERVEKYAAARGYSLGEVFVDLDQSGGKLERPELDKALVRIDSGLSGGIVVAKIDRFARSLVGALHVIERVQEAGGVILSAEGDLDTTTPTGRMVARMLLTLAEFELDRIRESWSTSQKRAVSRGVHIASRVPTGYRRPKKGEPLKPEPAAVPVIRELFRRRSSGAGWTELARYLDDSGIRGPYGNQTWTPAAVAKMIRNRVYLGEARSGRFVNADAHEPLVTRAEWEAAQGEGVYVSKPRSGEGLLLSGLVRCAGCRYLMKPDTMRGRNGERLGIYRCRRRYAAGQCPAPAAIMARLLDPWAEATFLAALDEGGPLAEASAGSPDVEEALLRVQAAEDELDSYVRATPAAVIGPKRYRDGLDKRQAALDDAQAALVEARRAYALSDTISLTPGDLVEAWHQLSTPERRHLLASSLDAIVIRAVRGNGHPTPTDERALIVWRGEAPDDLPRRGRRQPLSSFPWPSNERPANIRVAAR